MLHPWLFWLILSLVMIVAEVLTVSFFAITVAAGSLVAMVIALLTPVLWIQGAVFLFSTLIFFVRLRPLIQRYFPVHNEVYTTVDRLRNKTGVVSEDIDNIEGKGQIKFEGEIWSARSVDGSIITSGTKVVIKKVEGVKAIVDKIDKEGV